VRYLQQDLDRAPTPIDGLADVEPVAPAKAKRKKSTSPTARTLAECRKRGWIAQNVEQFVRFPPPGHRLDLFGVIDIVAITPATFDVVLIHGQQPRLIGHGQTIGIQATASAAHHAHRRDKILAEPRAKAWVEAGNRLELWSWSKRGDRGKQKRWTLRVETYEEMRASQTSGNQSMGYVPGDGPSEDWL
jgi:hypothetical protein